MLAPCAYVYIIHFRYSLGKDFFENFLFICKGMAAVAPSAGSSYRKGQKSPQQPSLYSTLENFRKTPW